MKTLKTIFLIGLTGSLLSLTTSCMVLLTEKDHGHHKGWYKNSHNPHHPKTTNPGHTKPKKKKGHK
jgi:hypothetical protein